MQKEIYIWGAGHYGVLTALDLENKGVKIKSFIDKNAKAIKTRLGVPVFEYNEVISVNNQDFQIIIAIQSECAIREIVEILMQAGLNEGKNFEFSQLIPISSGFVKPPFKLYKEQLKTLAAEMIIVHLTEHCNLNCAHCLNNNPIADPGFPNLEQLELDFIKLSKLSNGVLGSIHLTGGEPLMNPDVINIMQIVRKNFPNSEIIIITNGILLTKMKDDFWTACKNNDVTITISYYPIKLDLEKIYQIANKYAVNIFWRDSISKNGGKSFYTHKYDMNGKRDIYKAYQCCYLKCTNLKDGKIYTCQQIPNSKYLEKAFNVHFSISNEDFLVLDEIKNVQEILDFISSPSPFCRYCATEDRQWVQWKISERKKEEWIL